MMDEIVQNILNLNKNEQDRLFWMLSDNVDILLKVVPSSTLLAYIASGLTDDNSPIIQAYSAWKNKQ